MSCRTQPPILARDSLARRELGLRAAAALDIENSTWAYKFYWMTTNWWWDEDSQSFVRETRPEFWRSTDDSGCG